MALPPPPPAPPANAIDPATGKPYGATPGAVVDIPGFGPVTIGPDGKIVGGPYHGRTPAEAALVANGQWRGPTSQPGFQSGNGAVNLVNDVVSPVGKAVTAPFQSPLSLANDARNGDLSRLPGDYVYGQTAGVAGNDTGMTRGSFVTPSGSGSTVSAGGLATDLVNGITDPFSPEASDPSVLGDVTKRAFNTQDALTGRIQNLEANPTVAPQSDLVQLDQTQIDPLRQRQTVALDQLQAAADGRVPSAAEILGRDQANRASALAYGQAAALQGGQSSGGALRQALDAGTQLVGDANTQLIANRAKEMEAARNSLVQGIGAARGQESADATTNANLDQNKNLANTTAAVTTHGQDVSEKGDLISGGNTALGIGAANEKAKLDAATANAASANAYKGAIVGGAASVIPKIVSDRRAKTNVAHADLVQLADDLPGYTFDYKSAQDGPGRRVGIMAQDAAKARMGRSLVRDDDDGALVLDGPNAVGAALAMSAAALRKADALRKRR